MRGNRDELHSRYELSYTLTDTNRDEWLLIFNMRQSMKKSITYVAGTWFKNCRSRENKGYMESDQVEKMKQGKQHTGEYVPG